MNLSPRTEEIAPVLALVKGPMKWMILLGNIIIFSTLNRKFSFIYSHMYVAVFLQKQVYLHSDRFIWFNIIWKLKKSFQGAFKCLRRINNKSHIAGILGQVMSILFNAMQSSFKSVNVWSKRVTFLHFYKSHIYIVWWHLLLSWFWSLSDVTISGWVPKTCHREVASDFHMIIQLKTFGSKFGQRTLMV